jgi:hypothetical protein
MSNQIQNKLSQFEVQPPEGVWNRVADALDNLVLADTGRKLTEVEVQPEAGIWNRIVRQLDGVAPAKVIPFYKKYSRPLKYGSAVAMFAFIALVANLLVSKKGVSETMTDPMVGPTINKVHQVPAKETTGSFPKSDIAGKEDIAAAQEITASNQGKNDGLKKRNSLMLRPTLLGITSTTDNLVPKVARRNTIIAFNEDDEKYMAYSMEDGNAVKLPKKMFDALTCPTKDVGCLQRIRQLQEKIAASALFADFTGVLDILNNLGENQ